MMGDDTYQHHARSTDVDQDQEAPSLKYLTPRQHDDKDRDYGEKRRARPANGSSKGNMHSCEKHGQDKPVPYDIA